MKTYYILYNPFKKQFLQNFTFENNYFGTGASNLKFTDEFNRAKCFNDEEEARHFIYECKENNYFEMKKIFEVSGF